MTIQQQLPKRPRIGYRPALTRQFIRYCANRIIVALAVRGILILYALLQFLLAKYRAE